MPITSNTFHSEHGYERTRLYAYYWLDWRYAHHSHGQHNVKVVYGLPHSFLGRLRWCLLLMVAQPKVQAPILGAYTRIDPNYKGVHSYVEQRTTYISMEWLSFLIMSWRGKFRWRHGTDIRYRSHSTTVNHPTDDVYYLIMRNDTWFLQLDWFHIHEHPTMRSSRGTSRHNLHTHTRR